ALERSAFAAPAAEPRGAAPVRTFVVAALLCGAAAVLVVLALPREIGDRAPGATITGTVPAAGPSLVELEARAKAEPRDIPSQLALADAYLRDGRAADAARVYRAVLTLDRDNVPALNGLAVILELAGERDGAEIAVDRVLALRPRDAEALFMKGLIRYKKEDWRGAVDAWRVFLEVGELHPAAGMVRPLYDDARNKLGPR
ncbi:MAG: tetratricopeptide repeat protein, partial [Candidatus Limnocylindria bacterium]|nr:tetratricopeptide repeat protein [Candidatus Limnocylindria bacterium]